MPEFNASEFNESEFNAAQTNDQPAGSGVPVLVATYTGMWSSGIGGGTL